MPPWERNSIDVVPQWRRPEKWAEMGGGGRLDHYYNKPEKLFAPHLGLQLQDTNLSILFFNGSPIKLRGQM